MRGSYERGRGGRGGPRPARGGGVRAVAGAAQLRSQMLLNKSNSAKRLQRDLKELREAEIPLVGVAATPLDDSIFIWHANIRAPSDSVYYGGVFHLHINFPQDYPCSPPGI